MTSDAFAAEHVAASYDLIAEDYAAQFFDELERKPFDRDLLDDFAACVTGKGTAADVGCGPGHLARYLSARGVDVVGIDLSERMVATAQRLNPNLRFERHDMTALDVPAASWAGAACFYSLIHLRRSAVPTALTELYRTLCPGALLLIAVHGGTGELHSDKWAGKAVTMSATLFTLDEMATAIESAGFELESAQQRDPYDFEHPTPRLYFRALRP